MPRESWELGEQGKEGARGCGQRGMDVEATNRYRSFLCPPPPMLSNTSSYPRRSSHPKANKFREAMA